MRGVGEAQGEGRGNRPRPAEQAEDGRPRNRTEEREANTVQLVVVVVPAVHELEHQVHVGKARRPYRHAEAPRVAELSRGAGGEDVYGQPGDRVGDRRRQLEPPLEDLEVTLLGLDDVVEEGVDGGDLA